MSFFNKEEIVELVKAQELAVDRMLNRKGAIWGPKWVEVVVRVPELEDTVVVLGWKKPWDEAWGEECDFVLYATKKLELSERTGVPSEVAAKDAPWLLKDGENFYAGGVSKSGISVGVSGANEDTDKRIADFIFGKIIALGRRKQEELKEQGKNYRGEA